MIDADHFREFQYACGFTKMIYGNFKEEQTKRDKFYDFFLYEKKPSI